MNRHKSIRMVFALSLILVALAVFVGHQHWSWFLFPVVVYLVILVIGTVNIGWRYFLPARIHGPRDHRHVALTFDDGPDRFTLQVAECLSRHSISGTFFMIGNKIEQHPETLRAMDEMGHVIGNHSYRHKWSGPLRFTRTIAEGIEKTNQLIERTIHKKPRFYRPPFGITNPRIARAVHQHDMIPVGWDVRSYDTVIGASERLSRRLKSKVKNGSIILLHDTGEGLVGFLDAFIPWLLAEGYRIVSLEELINEKAYA